MIKLKKLRATLLNRGPLTEKEAEVLRLLCEGYFRPEIAQKLNRSLGTVSSHIEHIAQKLDTHSSTETVLIAEQLGLVKIEMSQRCSVVTIWLLLLLIGYQEQSMLRLRHSHRPPIQRIRTVRDAL